MAEQRRQKRDELIQKHGTGYVEAQIEKYKQLGNVEDVGWDIYDVHIEAQGKLDNAKRQQMEIALGMLRKAEKMHGKKEYGCMRVYC